MLGRMVLSHWRLARRRDPWVLWEMVGVESWVYMLNRVFLDHEVFCVFVDGLGYDSLEDFI